MLKRSMAAVILGIAVSALACAAEGADRDRPNWLLPMPEVDADPRIPTLKQRVGHEWGADISSHSEIENYLRALSEAAPDRTRLVRYGETIEKRGLYYLVITSKKNLRVWMRFAKTICDLPTRASRMPRALAPSSTRIRRIVWMAYGVHGDEISSGDAALLTAYHLLADRRPATSELLDKVVVILDPMQNPDGRDRFVNFHRGGRGVEPDAEPLAAERVQGLGGRPVQSLPF